MGRAVSDQVGRRIAGAGAPQGGSRGKRGGKAYQTSDQRAAEPGPWLPRYNRHRPQGGIVSQTPVSRLRLTEDKLLSIHA